jgi:putative GTP pyrophosphokinase
MQKLSMFEQTSSLVLPSEEQLMNWSFRTSLDKSTNKLSVTDGIAQVVSSDAHSYETVLSSNTDISEYCYRIKAPDSIRRKVATHPELRFQSVFNDILSLRICMDEYLTNVPDYLRLVDLTQGKSVDDGYRAQHLYFKRDNYSYVIEIQIWAGKDAKFNTWSHELAYKYIKHSDVLRKVRELYDNGVIASREEFKMEVLKLWQQD